MSDSGGALSVVYVSMVAAVIVGMKKEGVAPRELHDGTEDFERRTSKELTTDDDY